jgi:hypothetical protein
MSLLHPADLDAAVTGQADDANADLPAVCA